MAWNDGLDYRTVRTAQYMTLMVTAMLFVVVIVVVQDWLLKYCVRGSTRIRIHTAYGPKRQQFFKPWLSNPQGLIIPCVVHCLPTGLQSRTSKYLSTLRWCANPLCSIFWLFLLTMNHRNMHCNSQSFDDKKKDKNKTPKTLFSLCSQSRREKTGVGPVSVLGPRLTGLTDQEAHYRPAVEEGIACFELYSACVEDSLLLYKPVACRLRLRSRQWAAARKKAGQPLHLLTMCVRSV